MQWGALAERPVLQGFLTGPSRVSRDAETPTQLQPPVN
jgi:hypothetical protein